MPIEKAEWITRYRCRFTALAPHAPTGQLQEVAETYWFYLRHRLPEDVAAEKHAGRLVQRSRADAWIGACVEAIRGLDDSIDERETLELATQLWDADLLRAVDPYVMANALWDQAILLSRSDENLSRHPLSDLLRQARRDD